MKPTALVRRSATVGLGILCLAACSCGSSEQATAAPMDRCEGARTQTVNDLPGDQLRTSLEPDKLRALKANPAAYDIRRVTVAATDTTLCASVTFAGRTRQIREIFLLLSEIPPKRNRAGSLAHLQFGVLERNVARLNGFGDVDFDEPIEDVTTSPIEGRTVQVAVPIRWLGPRVLSPRSPGLDPTSFAWRVVVTYL